MTREDSVAGERGPVRSPHTHITGIDGLRAIAVLSVLAYHIDENILPGGFVGVDLFFVISGFVVSMATSSIRASGFGTLLLAFYRRRIIRILPAALVFILATQLAGVLFQPITDLMTTPDLTAGAATAGMSNIILWLKAGDYFSPGIKLNLFTHTWSLAVEEQFYILFPFFATFTLLGNTMMRRRLGVLALLIASIGSLIIAAYTTPKSPSFAFYMLPARFWELSAGMLLFIAIGRSGGPDEASAPRATVIMILSLLGTGLLLGSLIFVRPDHFPFPNVIVPVLAGVILIYVVSLSSQSMLSRALSLSPLRYIGRISYSLYLWHWGVIVLMLWTVGLETPLQKIAAAVISFGLADLSYRFVERPVRGNAMVAKVRDWHIAIVGLCAIAAAATGVAALTIARPIISLSKTKDLNTWLGASQGEGGRCQVGESKQSFWGGRRYDFTLKDCKGTADSRHLYIVGDSHAWAYQRLSGNIGRTTAISSTIYFNTGCAVLPMFGGDASAGTCRNFVKNSLAAVATAAKSGDVVFLPGLRVQRYREYWDRDLAAPVPVLRYTPAMIAAATNPLSTMLDRGVRVIVEAPKPVYTTAALRCVDWFTADNPHCHRPSPTKAEEQARRAPALALIAAVRAYDPRIEVLEPFPILCPGIVCAPMLNGKPVAADGDHASGWTNDRMTPVLVDLLGPDPKRHQNATSSRE